MNKKNITLNFNIDLSAIIIAILAIIAMFYGNEKIEEINNKIDMIDNSVSVLNYKQNKLCDKIEGVIVPMEFEAKERGLINITNLDITYDDDWYIYAIPYIDNKTNTTEKYYEEKIIWVWK